MSYKYTNESFIKMLREVHSDRYNYSKVEYKSCKEKITIGCKVHGDFELRANAHQQGQGCIKCAKEARPVREKKPIVIEDKVVVDKTPEKTEKFIKKAVIVHGNTYLYDRVVYKNSHSKVTVYCQKHGYFEICATSHLIGGGCQLCGYERVSVARQYDTETFIKKAKELHGELYDYSVCKYSSAKEHVTIGCRKCGNFRQAPTNHLNGNGCPVCSKTGYNRGKPGHFYILSFQDILKVGITNIGVDTRKCAVSKSSGKQFDVAASLFFDNGQIPFDIEKQALAWLRANYSPIDERFDGYTECFTGCSVTNLIDFIVPLAAHTEATHRPIN